MSLTTDNDYEEIESESSDNSKKTINQILKEKKSTFYLAYVQKSHIDAYATCHLNVIQQIRFHFLNFHDF